jgi:protein-disulfide isomerase
MAPKRRLGLVLFALAAAGGLHAASQAATSPAAPPAEAAVSVAPEEALGNPQAKVTVIEYASASCPHCARVNNEVLPELKKKYIDTGKVRYVFREMLTDPVSFAGTAFMMARCGGDKNYFAVLDDVFHEQQEIYQSGDLPGGLLKIGAKYGLDKDKINACMSDKAVKAMNQRADQAGKDGMQYTPTFLIGGSKLEGEKTLDDLSAVIDPLLAK